MKIINLTDFSDKNWNWLKKNINDDTLEWSHYPSKAIKLPKLVPKKDSASRVLSAAQAVFSSLNSDALLVSHGPRPAMYAGNIAKILNPELPHLVYSFNFTHLPRGLLHKTMSKAFQQADRFVVFSSVEKELYSQYFDIDSKSIDMLHWAVHMPDIDRTILPIEGGEYICAIGSQGRDYATLLAAMKRLSHIKCVIVASAENIQGLEIPDNVIIHTNIPLNDAHNILMHSKFMVLPLRDSDVPCGHVTIVSSMLFNKAIIATASKGISDYITNDQTGLTFDPQDTAQLIQKIQNLWDDPLLKDQLVKKGYAFAVQNCTHQNAVNYLNQYLFTLKNK